MNAPVCLLPGLLFRPAVEVGEGPRGFLRRLSDHNRVPLRWLDRAGLRFELDALREIGCVPTDLGNSEVDEYVREVASSRIRFAHAWLHRCSRYCPICLRESGQWRIEWELRFADACAVHGTWLIDCCECGRPLDWHRPSMLACRCGRSILKAAAARSPASLQVLAQQIGAKALNRLGLGLAAPFGRLDLESLQHVVWLLGTFAGPVTGPRPARANKIDLLSASWPVSTLAAEIVTGWPEAFERVLDRFLQDARHSVREGRLAATFGGLYAHLYRRHPAALAEIRRVFEHHVALRWRGALGRRNRRFAPETIALATWIPLSHVAMRLRRRRSMALENLVASGAQIASRTTAAGRTFVMVRRDSAVASPEASLDLRECAKRLGLSRRRARDLALAQVLPAARSGGFNSPWIFTAAQVEMLLRPVQSAPTFKTAAVNTVSLGHVLQYWGLTDEAARALVRSIIGGTVAIVGCLQGAPGLSGLLLRMTEIRQIQSSASRRANSADHLTLPQVAERLGVKQEVAYLLTRKRLIEAQLESCNLKRVRWMVSTESLDEFTQRYAFGRDLALQVGCSPRAMVEELKARGIGPVSGPHIDGGRQVVYMRNQRLAAALVCITAQRGRPAPPYERLVQSND